MSLILLSLGSSGAFAAPAKQILFLSFDYGDANNFNILIDHMPAEYQYKVIAIGKAYDLFNNRSLNNRSLNGSSFNNSSFNRNLAHSSQCLSKKQNSQLTANRSQLLPQSSLHCLFDAMKQADFIPDVIVSSMSSAALAQIINAYKNDTYHISKSRDSNEKNTKQTRIIAYYDNLDPYPALSPLVNANSHHRQVRYPEHYTTPFLHQLDDHALNALFIPNERIKASFIHHFNSKKLSQNINKAIHIVGSPALMLWQASPHFIDSSAPLKDKNKQTANNSNANVNVNANKITKSPFITTCPTEQQMFKLLDIDPSKKTVIFAGGTSQSYQKAFIQFVKAMAQLPQYEALVTYHPKTQGHLEQAAILNNSTLHNVKLVDPHKISTYCLTRLSPVFIVHQSSMGTAALSVPKNVIFITKNYTNDAIEHGLADRAYQVENIKKTIINAFNKKPNSHNFYTYFGMPEHAVDAFYLALKNETENTRRSL
ncbi:hypothetical protein [uncultured Shewanella sp.]|uniref:hypothetical protein n=1 Tax=uncultured Shewanella sp. TaxID=173975 RepID=UPI00262C12BE|nr:hypothetical protein [uncultured Shewanella sp.]